MIEQTALWLRSCPRCRGDLYLAPTIEPVGPEFKCLQCARVYAQLPARNHTELMPAAARNGHARARSGSHRGRPEYDRAVARAS